MISVTTPMQPVVIARVFSHDAHMIHDLVERNAPYWATQRYFGSNAETEVGERATREYGGDAAGQDVFIVPLFRGDWVTDGQARDDVRPLLRHKPFIDGAREVFGATRLVRPFSIYVNLTYRLPIAQGTGHVDCPEFRGMNRNNAPMWLLAVMGMSGLFERERVNIATAVSWFYRGTDGGFEYWPDGIDAPSRVHAGDIFNTGIVGDNDRMHHRALAVGKLNRENPAASFVPGMTTSSLLEHEGGEDWRITESGKTLATFSFDELRVSLSWKARVFEDSADETRYREHTEDITLNEVWARIAEDLDGRGIARPEVLAHGTPEVVRLLGDVYVKQPNANLGYEDLDSSPPAA